MKTEIGVKCAVMIVGMALMFVGVFAGSAQEVKPADPFVKGNKPAVMDAKNAVGGVEAQQSSELMKGIIIPEVDFREANIRDVVTYLQKMSVDLDAKKRGVNIVLNLRDSDAQVPAITLSARHISLLEALNIVTKVTNLKYSIENGVVMIVSGGDSNGIDYSAASEAPSQVEVEVQFVAFDLTNVEKLVSGGGLNADSLTTLWIKGGGHLLAAPRVLTQSGSEAIVKGVTECIYPSEYYSFPDDANTSSNTTATASRPAVVPGGFETREMGAILQVLPELSSDGSRINLTMTPQIVEDPVWRDYGSSYRDSNGQEQPAHMEQPFFHTYSLSTSISVADGQRVLIGGGMLSRDCKQMVYVFVTARKVAVRGENIK